MDGLGIDTVGRFNERGGILGSKLPSRREGGIIAREVIVA
jgi:hypothetical protein